MENGDITISEVHEFSDEVAEAIRRFIQQEGKNSKPLRDEDLREMLANPSTTVFIARDSATQQIAGMVTLVVFRIPYVKKSTMEDLVVDEAFRGRGIGTRLIKKVVETAQAQGAHYLDFTSRPRRADGNSMYEKLGFQKRETNVYRHIFDYGEV